ERYAPQYRIGPIPFDPEDIVGHAFETIAGSLKKIELREPLEHYVRAALPRVVRRYCIREREKRLLPLERGQLESLTTSEDGVLEQLVVQEELTFLIEALAFLPPTLRDALLVRHRAGETKGSDEEIPHNVK